MCVYILYSYPLSRYLSLPLSFLLSSGCPESFVLDFDISLVWRSGCFQRTSYTVSTVPLSLWLHQCKIFSIFIHLQTNQCIPLMGQVTIGIWGALMIVSGLIGAGLTSIVLGLTRKYKEVGVFALGMCVLCSIWFLEVTDFLSICWGDANCTHSPHVGLTA